MYTRICVSKADEKMHIAHANRNKSRPSTPNYAYIALHNTFILPLACCELFLFNPSCFSQTVFHLFAFEMAWCSTSNTLIDWRAEKIQQIGFTHCEGTHICHNVVEQALTSTTWICITFHQKITRIRYYINIVSFMVIHSIVLMMNIELVAMHFE